MLSRMSESFSSGECKLHAPRVLCVSGEHRLAALRSPARETRALPRGGIWREFLPVFSVTHFPAQRRNAISQLVAFPPIFFASCGLAVLCELRHVRRYHDFSLRFEIENIVDPRPPIQPGVCRGSVVI